MPEGKGIGDRHKWMWIDLLHDAKDTDLNMSDAGITELGEYCSLYKGTWSFQK